MLYATFKHLHRSLLTIQRRKSCSSSVVWVRVLLTHTWLTALSTLRLTNSGAADSHQEHLAGTSDPADSPLIFCQEVMITYASGINKVAVCIPWHLHCNLLTAAFNGGGIWKLWQPLLYFQLITTVAKWACARMVNHQNWIRILVGVTLVIGPLESL